MKKIFFVLTVFCAFLIFGFSVYAEDNSIWAVFNQNKQSTIYAISEASKTIVLPSPNLPSFSQISVPVSSASLVI